jgi:type IV pilus assembly protein PilE
MRSMTHTGQKGFSLIEILIVVVIVTLLASIAWPAYQDNVLRSRRAEAKSQLLDLAQCMERFNTSNLTYVNGPVRCPPPNADSYAINYAAVTRSTFTLVAAPQGNQTSDACGQLGVDQTGAKTHQGSAADRCW